MRPMLFKLDLSNIKKNDKQLPHYECVEIIKNLWLSGYDEIEKKLKTFDIVLNVAKEINIPNDIKSIKINLIDNSDENIYEYLDKYADMIDILLNNNFKILVCCRMGVSRSATFIIAYIMKYKQDLIKNINIDDDLDLLDKNCLYHKAFRFVKQKRDCINPNIGFILDLYKYETYLKENNLINI